MNDDNGQRKTLVIYDDVGNKKTEIETESLGSGGGITGSGPSLVKRNFKEYDSLNNLIYHSYRETSYNGCLGSIEKWEVTSKTLEGNIRKLELVKGYFKLTYVNKAGQADSSKTIPYSDWRDIDWLRQNDQ